MRIKYLVLLLVVVISAAIHGINDSVAKDFESTGPTTFFLSRFPITFERCDGTDATCKWLHNPRLQFADAKALSGLSTVLASASSMRLGREVRYKDHVLSNTLVIGYTANWTVVDHAGERPDEEGQIHLARIALAELVQPRTRR